MPEEMSLESLKNWVENVHERYYIEMKKANELPSAFWESYSAFCNTSGGWIILGVSEFSSKNEIVGVGNPDKVMLDLWNQLSNRNKASFRSIGNQDVKQFVLGGKTVIFVHVNEAPESMKPVHIGDKLENSWIRTGDGDRKITKEELAAFLRNAQPGEDSLVIDGFSIADLDMDSVISYKERVNKRFPKKNYLEMPNEEFLVEIGACTKDRITGKVQVKRGALLFFGVENSIKDMYPHFHVDYFNRRGNNPRWIDRVSDDEPGDYEMNLYNFYNIVNEKIRLLLQDSFALDENHQLRLPLIDFDETIRECLVNCLAHADYSQGYPSTKIEVFDGWFHFINPGKMLVSKEQFVIGGDSRTRNEVIMKLFRLLGASERQGFGGPLIFKTAIQNDFRRPEIVSDLQRTELKVWNIDLADSYPELPYEEKQVLRLIAKSAQGISINNIKKSLDISDYKVRKCVESLDERNLVRKEGNGPSTRYFVGFESIEFLTQLQIMMDSLKKHMA